MPNSRDYVWQKMYEAISALCGKSSLAERLENASILLAILRDDDLSDDAELGPDLKYVFKWTKDNLKEGRSIKLPGDVEFSRLVEKMLHILLETNGAD